MKVSELIELLQECSPDDEVRIEQPSHDYWKTVLAVEIRHVEPVTVSESAYHNEMQLDEEGEIGIVLLASSSHF